jgi:NADH dehydrogenase [ubiquinone] 1 alpha subcomplex assembly factor 7
VSPSPPPPSSPPPPPSPPPSPASSSLPSPPRSPASSSLPSPPPPSLSSGRTAADALTERIHREGPIPFDAFVDGALNGPGGFFARGHGAGRAGQDFVTSPEVGRLYGALVGVAIDRWWRELGSPDPFFVVEAGAGRGRLAADVLAAAPECTGALRYLLVEPSAALRQTQRELLVLEPVEDAIGPTLLVDDDTDAVPVTGAGPIVSSLGDLPEVRLTGVLLANELLDNLPFRLVERSADRWLEVRVALDPAAAPSRETPPAAASASPPVTPDTPPAAGSDTGPDAGPDAGRDQRFSEVLVPATDELASEADVVAAGAASECARFPVPTGAREWLRAAARTISRGRLVIVDYAAPAAELVARGPDGWLRTYRDHARGVEPIVGPGTQDITHDLPLEYLEHVAGLAGWTLVEHTNQADWLRSLGIDTLVEHARGEWDARAHVGDLEALGHRSRVTEAAALTDASGLGAHRVLVFERR